MGHARGNCKTFSISRNPSPSVSLTLFILPVCNALCISIVWALLHFLKLKILSFLLLASQKVSVIGDVSPGHPQPSPSASFSDQLRAHRQTLNQSFRDHAKASSDSIPLSSGSQVSGADDCNDKGKQDRAPIHIPREKLFDQLHREMENRNEPQKPNNVAAASAIAVAALGGSKQEPPDDCLDIRSSQFRRQGAINTSEDSDGLTAVDEDEPEFQVTYL